MRTEIATLGEFGLIDRLTEGIKPENESTKYGVGDDAAVLSYPSEKQLLVTTDLLMEGVHFDLTYVPLKHLGYKSGRNEHLPLISRLLLIVVSPKGRDRKSVV